MFVRKPLAPGKIKILSALRDMCKPYKELKSDTELSDPVLSDHLKWLQKKKYIGRDIDTRKYYLLKKAKNKLPIFDFIEKLNLILRRGQVAPTKYSNEAIVSSLSDPMRKNIDTIANCISVTHEFFMKLNPSAGNVSGSFFESSSFFRIFKRGSSAVSTF